MLIFFYMRHISLVQMHVCSAFSFFFLKLQTLFVKYNSTRKTTISAFLVSSICFISHFMWLIKINYSYVNRGFRINVRQDMWVKIFEVCSTAASVSLLCTTVNAAVIWCVCVIVFCLSFSFLLSIIVKKWYGQSCHSSHITHFFFWFLCFDTRGPAESKLASVRVICRQVRIYANEANRISNSSGLGIENRKRYVKK